MDESPEVSPTSKKNQKKLKNSNSIENFKFNNVRIELEIQSNATTSDSSNETGTRARETYLESIER